MLNTIEPAGHKRRARAAPRRSVAAGGSPVFERALAAVPATPLLVQRKCACGGSCPGCREDDEVRQAKLAISTPGDRFEQEADRVADQVTHSTNPVVGRISPVARIQRKSSSGSSRTPTGFVADAGTSRPLDAATRAFFEPRFGQDFSHVRIHDGPRAASSAGSLAARAYTAGSHIVFGAGQYAPQSTTGRHLLAHELTHVVQQRAGGIATVQRSAMQVHSCREGEGPPYPEPPVAGEKGPRPLIYRGVSRKRSRRPSVGDAQELLNRFLKQLGNGKLKCAAGADYRAIEEMRTTLNQDPLDVDCRFGPNTEKATKMFQRCVFPYDSSQWDGKIGPKTWAELEKFRSGAPAVPPGPGTVVPTLPKCSAPVLQDYGTFIGQGSKSTARTFKGGPNVQVELEFALSATLPMGPPLHVNVTDGLAFLSTTLGGKSKRKDTLVLGRKRCVVDDPRFPTADNWSISIDADRYQHFTFPFTYSVPLDFLMLWKIYTDWLPGQPKCCP